MLFSKDNKAVIVSRVTDRKPNPNILCTKYGIR